jgi:hypothetical protein
MIRVSCRKLDRDATYNFGQIRGENDLGDNFHVDGRRFIAGGVLIVAR